MNSKLYSMGRVEKKPALTALDPHAYDPSTEEASVKGDSARSASLLSSNSEATSASETEDTANKYLRCDDLLSAKRLLNKCTKTMVDSACHHEAKLQMLDSNLSKFQDSVAKNLSVLNDLTVDLDRKVANRFNETLEKLDPQMNAFEEIAYFSSELSDLEAYLDLTAPEIQRELATIERANRNLAKQKELEDRVKEMEDRSIRHRALCDAFEFDNDRMIRKATAPPANKRGWFGKGETSSALPIALVELTEFQRELFNMKRFYTACSGVPKVNFIKFDALIDEAKDTISTHLFASLPTALSPPLSTATSFVSEKSSLISTSKSTFVSSSNALELAISRSCSDLSNWTSPYSSRASSLASLCVADTQASWDSLAATQSSISLPTASRSNLELDLDRTQSSVSSLKTAISLDDILTSDTQSMDSSSTMAI